MTNICSICCNSYTDHLRKIVTCLYCNHECCRNCISKYVLYSPIAPHCMACKKTWNYEFMYNSMSKTFVLETLKKHTEQLMIEREKALLPITQPIIERIHKIRKLTDTNYDINKNILVKRYQEREALFRLRTNRNELITNGMRIKSSDIIISEMLTDSDQSDEERQQIRKIHAKFPIILQDNIREWSTLRRYLKTLQEKRRANDVILNRLLQKNERRKEMIQQYYDTGVMNNDYVTESESEETDKIARTRKRRTFIRTCPKNTCKGFLNNNWYCGMCNTLVCSRCHEMKNSENEHICDENIVATTNYLMKDTKSCPQCGVQIHKIDGCNMMFCTQCHTPFCWKTGDIIKNERIHNPHYYEWLRQNTKDGTIPREPGDNPCGAGDINGRVSIRALRMKLQECNMLRYEIEDILWNIHRMHVHIEMVEIPRLQYNRINNTDLRIRYMLNEYTDKTWKHEIYKRQKKIDKNTAIRQIYETIYTVVRDEFNKILILDPLHFQNIVECFSIIDTLRDYANSQFMEISKLYQCKVPKIQEGTWNIISHKVDTRIRLRKNHSIKMQ